MPGMLLLLYKRKFFLGEFGGKFTFLLQIVFETALVVLEKSFVECLKTHLFAVDPLAVQNGPVDLYSFVFALWTETSQPSFHHW